MQWFADLRSHLAFAPFCFLSVFVAEVLSQQLQEVVYHLILIKVIFEDLAHAVGLIPVCGSQIDGAKVYVRDSSGLVETREICPNKEF